MLSTAARGRQENEKNGTELLIGWSELDWLGRYSNHEYGLGHSFDRGVGNGNAVADDRRVELLHNGQTIRDLSLARDETSLGECVGQDLDHLTTRAGTEPAHHRIIFNKID